jgi:4-amino-4-deoxy-L-arabinose transferase-like glycosyltransferase
VGDATPPFTMSRGRWRTVTALVACLATLAVVSTYPVFNQMWDEPAHIAAGMEWLSRGRYTYEPQHPPLARIAAAIGPYVGGARTIGRPKIYDEGRALLGEGAHYRRMLTLARLGMLPFLWAILVVCAVWGRRAAGPGGGALAVLFAATNPNLLAHAGVAGTDLAPAALGAAALLAWMRWREQPTMARALLFGAVVGLAAAAKFSAVVYLAPALLLGEGARLSLRGTTPVGATLAASWRQALAGCGATALVLWAIYRFDVGPLEPGGIWVPAPALFRGLRPFFHHATTGHPAFLLGRVSQRGWWWYYLVVLAVKTPLPLLTLAIVGAVERVRAARTDGWPALVPLAGALAVLAVALASHVDLGVRIVITIYPFLAVLAARGATAAWERAGTRAVVGARRTAVVALVAATIVIPVQAWPDYVAYFNPVAGARPERVLVDSNLDWGQDLYRLADTVRARRIDSVRVHYFGSTELQAVGLVNARRLDPNERTTGWVAASETFLAGVWSDTSLRWLARRTPVARIGPSMRLYYITPDSAR